METTNIMSYKILGGIEEFTTIVKDLWNRFQNWLTSLNSLKHGEIRNAIEI